VDRGSGVVQLPTQGIAPIQGCSTCAIVQSVTSQRTLEGAAYVVEAANEDALVLSSPQLAGLVVIPRQCISVLGDLHPIRQAQVLAAVRSATLLIGLANQEPATRIVALTDSSTSAGHVSYHVMPNGSDDMTGTARSSLPRANCRATAVAKADGAR
jgi:diadenosine tetraphosphate (Ap4A) HIT family hydrolase